MPDDLQIIPADQIDKVKWDQCICHAGNGLIYSRYDYLNAMCDHWHGLVVNDYETVMALPWRKKMGIRYLYEPAFIQQLGVIERASISTEEILSACYEFSNYGDILFNFSNSLSSRPGLKNKTNLILELSPGYEKISSLYKKDLRQNLKKSEKTKSSYVDGDIKSAVDAYRLFYGHRFTNIKEDDYGNFEKLCGRLAGSDMAFVKKVINAEGIILCIAIFLKDDKRIYNIMNTTLDAGRDAEANHFLIDSVIREYAGQDLLFDFEGSDLPGVKSFYEKFGATNQPYYHYHFNRLPLPLKLFGR